MLTLGFDFRGCISNSFNAALSQQRQLMASGAMGVAEVKISVVPVPLGAELGDPSVAIANVTPNQQVLIPAMTRITKLKR